MTSSQLKWLCANVVHNLSVISLNLIGVTNIVNIENVKTKVHIF